MANRVRTLFAKYSQKRTIAVGTAPLGIAVSLDGTRVYVSNSEDNTVSIIDTASQTVVGSPIPVGGKPGGVTVSPDGTRVYVTNLDGNTVAAINTTTHEVRTVAVGVAPRNVAVSPDGTRLYVCNDTSDNVSIIAGF